VTFAERCAIPIALIIALSVFILVALKEREANVAESKELSQRQNEICEAHGGFVFNGGRGRTCVMGAK
jgi:hypothetical protein